MPETIDIKASNNKELIQLKVTDLHDHFSFTERPTPCTTVTC